ncbi:GTPase activator [Binucleata daphniae]
MHNQIEEEDDRFLSSPVNILITDFDKNKLCEYKNNVNSYYFAFIRKRFSFFSAYKLRYGTIMHYWHKATPNDEFGYNSDYMTWHRMWSFHKLYIPYHFKITALAILQSDLSVEGIFRKNANPQNVIKANQQLQEIIDNGTEQDKSLALLNNFDTHTLCDLFCKLFNHTKTTLFPVNLRQYLYKAIEITNLEYKKQSVQIILANVPQKNLHLLEFIANFICNVSKINIEKSKQNKKGMNVHGICICIMPKIFLQKNECLTNTEHVAFISFLTYFCDDYISLLQTLPNSSE